MNLARIDYDERSIRESLPQRFRDENLAAIRYGYELTDAEIIRLAADAPPSRYEMNDAATSPAPTRGVDAAFDHANAQTTGSETG
jgi:hypothetical protein